MIHKSDKLSNEGSWIEWLKTKTEKNYEVLIWGLFCFVMGIIIGRYIRW